MKHYFSLASILLLSLGLLTGCRKSPVEAASAPPSADGLLELCLEGACLRESRASAVTYADESALHRWTWWVFDEDGLPVQCREGSALQASVKLLSGRYTVVVLANYPTAGNWALPLLMTERQDELLGRVADLSCNSLSGLLMAGMETVEMVPDQTVKVTVRLRRLVSKVAVQKIAVAFEDPILAARSTRLRALYLTNVCRRSCYGAGLMPEEWPSSPSCWYNPMGWHRDGTADAACDLLLGETELDLPLTPETPLTQTHSFYPFPNPTPPGQDRRTAEWSPRSTRLVLEVAVGELICYYPIRLPAMVRNHLYVAEEVVLKKLGSLDPEQEIPGAVEMRFSVRQDSGWDADYSVEEIS